MSAAAQNHKRAQSRSAALIIAARPTACPLTLLDFLVLGRFRTGRGLLLLGHALHEGQLGLAQNFARRVSDAQQQQLRAGVLMTGRENESGAEKGKGSAGMDDQSVSCPRSRRVSPLPLLPAIPMPNRPLPLCPAVRLSALSV